MDPRSKQGQLLKISGKIDFKLKLIRKNREGHFILIKRKIHQEDIAVLNVYTPNTKAPKFIKESMIQLKSQTEPHTVIVGDFITLLSPMDRSSTQKLTREMLELTEVINQMNLTDIYRTFSQTSWNFL